MRKLSRERFDALGGYCRKPQAVLYIEELNWFISDNERLLGTLIRDRVDSDFSCIVLGRDERGRYRFVSGTVSKETQFEALQELEKLFEEEETRAPEEHFQGDETGKKLELFKVIANNPAPSFSALANNPKYLPARKLIEAMIYYFDDPDNNFVKDFQSTGFDGRLWELYLFAAFHEQGFAFDRDEARPDYNAQSLYGSFFAEAATVKATIENGNNIETGLPLDEEQKREYLRNYIPIKYGSALFSKLQKKYWELAWVTGKPLTIAVHDCHYPNSVIWSERQLPDYLYGQTFAQFFDARGKEIRRPVKIQEHKWGKKTIPSGFFAQPEAENISAVITSTQSGIDKFNRMGILAGFEHGMKNVVRYGTNYVKRGDKVGFHHFAEDVCGSEYEEAWSDGMNVYHNPTAKHKLEPALLPFAAHFFLGQDREVKPLIPNVHVLNSMTSYGVPIDEMRKKLTKTTDALRKHD